MSRWSTGEPIRDPDHSPLRALAEGFPGAAVHVTGDLIWLNRFAEEVVGYADDELTDIEAWGQAVYDDREPEARRVYLAAREAGFPQPEVLTVRRKDGEQRLVEFSAYLGDGEELWIMRDVTDARRAEEELRDRQYRLQVAVTAAGLGIWEWDASTDTVTADRSVRRLFGLTDPDHGARFEEYLERVVDDDRAKARRAVAEGIRDRTGFDIEARIRAPHGHSRWVRVHGTVVDDPARLRVIGAVRDIDSYKRMDERLVHAARMESLGQLAGGVAHDFNNLLAVIRGQAEFVAREPGLSEKAAVRLRSIEGAVEKGAGMVSALLQLGRSDPDSVAVVDVNEVIDSMRDSLDHIVGEDVAVELRLDAAHPHVRFDEARLSAALINLASNARDAMPVGGVLAISTDDLASPDGEAPGEPWVRIVVDDTGSGMDADTRTRIFEPFFTTKAHGVGTGLGLTSVYDAVIDSGGTIDVESTPGAGTTFLISLPGAEPVAARPEAVSDRASAAPGRSVLVVEDDPEILEITADILRDAGYRVAAALGPTEALELVAAGERPDLLLTDVVMPDLPGPGLAARLRDTLPGLAVLFMSGYTADGRGDLPVDEADLIRKPFAHEDLLARVSDLLEAG